MKAIEQKCACRKNDEQAGTVVEEMASPFLCTFFAYLH